MLSAVIGITIAVLLFTIHNQFHPEKPLVLTAIMEVSSVTKFRFSYSLFVMIVMTHTIIGNCFFPGNAKEVRPFGI